nr:hypothetical protein [Myxococcota bacterium]
MIATIESAVTALAMMAVQGTLLALVALVLTRGGGLRPAWQAAVWLVVLAKFVLPWGPTMPWSLADVFAHLGDDAGGGPLVLGHAKAAATAASPALAPAVGWIAIAVVWLTGTAFVLGRALHA